jgi:ring-1,2-phenylacetyl-CoA epoxidase subunit PaaC
MNRCILMLKTQTEVELEIEINVVMSAHTIPQNQLLMLADTCLLWGHRISEWCGHGPALEEDIALTNTALDLIAHARVLYQCVARREMALGAKDASEDRLAYFRDPVDFQNMQLAEQPNGDYAQTIVRSLFLAAWFTPLWEQLALTSVDTEIRALATDAAKASRAQLRHAADWTVRFGDGTAESRRRVETAIGLLLHYVNELLAVSIDGVDNVDIADRWRATIAKVFALATLDALPQTLPDAAVIGGSRKHREALLGEMQSLARQHPNAAW